MEINDLTIRSHPDSPSAPALTHGFAIVTCNMHQPIAPQATGR
jgi:hypothetical protein